MRPEVTSAVCSVQYPRTQRHLLKQTRMTIGRDLTVAIVYLSI